MKEKIAKWAAIAGAAVGAVIVAVIAAKHSTDLDSDEEIYQEVLIDSEDISGEEL